MYSPIQKLLTLPLAAKTLLMASLGSLLFVFIMQFSYGLQPCVLCLWQRVPYGITTLLSLLALVLRPSSKLPILFLALCSMSFLVGMGLAVFHTGVELHWWAGTAGCAVQPLHGGSAEDLRKTLLSTVSPRCDEITWTFLGLSIANLNILWSLLLAFFSAAASAKNMETA